MTDDFDFFDVEDFYEEDDYEEDAWSPFFENFLDDVGDYDFIEDEDCVFRVSSDISKVDDFSTEIKYCFTEEIRPNVFSNGHKYGSDNMSFRKLYTLLCMKFNEGRFFIEDYFSTVYPRTMKSKVDSYFAELKKDIMNEYEKLMYGARYRKDGQLDRRQRKLLKRLSDFETFQDEYIKEAGQDIAKKIKDNIVTSLMVGAIPLSQGAFSLSEQARKHRIKAGLPEYPRFFASGGLIENIVIVYNVTGRSKWQTNQGILV